MSHASILAGFWISLVVILPIGLLLMILWGRKAYRRTMKNPGSKKVISVREIAGRAFIFMIPGILIFFIFCVPVFYFGNLLKQEDYIVKIIQVNHLKKDSPYLDKYKGTFGTR